MTHAVLHPSIVALVSLAASIGGNHPKQGLCHVERLRALGVTEDQIDLAVEIARHIRDEAAGQLDAQFDRAIARDATAPVEAPAAAACGAPTASGKPCC